jgi:N-methylhydantoinase A/oxoprolinase/acetone carboxylase beta subunit
MIMAINTSRYTFRVNIGGTFNDCVALSETGKIAKARSTPDEFRAWRAADALRRG